MLKTARGMQCDAPPLPLSALLVRLGGEEEEARAALEKIHGDADDVITEIKASKAL